MVKIHTPCIKEAQRAIISTQSDLTTDVPKFKDITTSHVPGTGGTTVKPVSQPQAITNTTDRLHLINSGGQPQFLELLGPSNSSTVYHFWCLSWSSPRSSLLHPVWSTSAQMANPMTLGSSHSPTSSYSSGSPIVHVPLLPSITSTCGDRAITDENCCCRHCQWSGAEMQGKQRWVNWSSYSSHSSNRLSLDHNPRSSFPSMRTQLQKAKFTMVYNTCKPEYTTQFTDL